MKKIKEWYNYIFYGDSLGSLALSTIISLLFIIFVFYPLIGWSLNSQFPIVAIQSSSMDHDGDFAQWWKSKAYCGDSICSQEDHYLNLGIDRNTFTSWDYVNGFNKGDVMVVKGYDEYELGDVIVFQTNDPTPIIHRIVDKRVENGITYYQTKGDANPDSIFYETMFGTLIDEYNVANHHVYGKAVFRVPYLGWVKILAWQILTTPLYALFLIIGIGFYYYFTNRLY